MGQYDAIAAKAKDMLSRKGKALELRVYTNASPVDPTKPWRMPESAPTVYPFRGLMFGFGISRFTKPGEMERKCFIPGDVAANASDVPNLTSLVFDAGSNELWIIEALEPIDPDGTPILFLAKVNQWPPKT